MHPILASAALGFAKRIMFPGAKPAGPNALHTTVLGPLAEELQFRVLPSRAGLPPVLGSAAFAMAHMLPDSKGRSPTGKWAAFRLADTFAGGMIYSQAYQQMGYLGAVACHGLHNLLCDWGRPVAQPVPTGTHYMGTSRAGTLNPRRKLRK